MPTYRVATILATADAIPANYVQNQFCVEVTGEDLDIDGVTAAIDTFYTGFSSSVLSSAIAQNGHMCKFYELPGLVPNYPIAERVWNLTSAPSNSPLPSEVSLVLSFHGQRTPGFPQARRRGRIYIGPLGNNVNSSGRPTTTAITAVNSAAVTLESNIALLPGHAWSVWSTVDQAAVPITGGWIDNAFDTQRRRGLDTTSRTTWTAT